MPAFSQTDIEIGWCEDQPKRRGEIFSISLYVRNNTGKTLPQSSLILRSGSHNKQNTVSVGPVSARTRVDVTIRVPPLPGRRMEQLPDLLSVTFNGGGLRMVRTFRSLHQGGSKVQDVGSSKQAVFSVGDKVERLNRKHNRPWHTGEIQTVRTNGSYDVVYDVVYDDGNIEQSVKPHHLRPKNGMAMDVEERVNPQQETGDRSQKLEQRVEDLEGKCRELTDLHQAMLKHLKKQQQQIQALNERNKELEQRLTRNEVPLQKLIKLAQTGGASSTLAATTGGSAPTQPIGIEFDNPGGSDSLQFQRYLEDAIRKAGFGGMTVQRRKAGVRYALVFFVKRTWKPRLLIGDLENQTGFAESCSSADNVVVVCMARGRVAQAMDPKIPGMHCHLHLVFHPDDGLQDRAGVTQESIRKLKVLLAPLWRQANPKKWYQW